MYYGVVETAAKIYRTVGWQERPYALDRREQLMNNLKGLRLFTRQKSLVQKWKFRAADTLQGESASENARRTGFHESDQAGVVDLAKLVEVLHHRREQRARLTPTRRREIQYNELLQETVSALHGGFFNQLHPVEPPRRGTMFEWARWGTHDVAWVDNKVSELEKEVSQPDTSDGPFVKKTPEELDAIVEEASRYVVDGNTIASSSSGVFLTNGPSLVSGCDTSFSSSLTLLSTHATSCVPHLAHSNMVPLLGGSTGCS
jgi:hypothetical protein